MQRRSISSSGEIGTRGGLTDERRFEKGKEPAVWVENQRRQKEERREVRAPLVRIFKRALLGNTVSASWWMTSSFVVYYSINALFATHLQQDLHFTPAQVAFPVAMTSLLGLIASGIWGYLSDRIGRRWSGILPGLLTIPVAALYLLPSNPHLVVWGFILQGAFGQAMAWLNPVYLTERFPTEVRAAASAFCYHIGAIFGGGVPPIITLLAGYHHMGLASAMLAGTVVGAISFCLALLAGPETKGTRFAPDLVVD